MNITIEKCPAFHDELGDLIQFVTDRLLQKVEIHSAKYTYPPLTERILFAETIITTTPVKCFV